MQLVQLEVDARSGIAQLRFNRPHVLNAIDVPMARALRDQVNVLAADPRVRCVVLSGQGKAFLAGGDLAPLVEDFGHAPQVVDDLLDAMYPAIEGLRSINAPVIAAVHGAVAGAGLSLMAGCDLVLAAEGTRFLMAFDRVGLPPDCGGTYYLPRLIGPRHMAELYLLGSTLTAEQAQALGLVNRVVPATELVARSQQWAEQIASGPTRACGEFKRLVGRSLSSTLPEQLEAERAAVQAAMLTEDFRAGAGAFMAHQWPRFAGH
ncbi:MAG TPA: enoyl-CoA hydratase-related protein [Methylibium sp.]|nr:enoyl-CoA hydratase-related protein [Methylibium sp.]